MRGACSPPQADDAPGGARAFRRRRRPRECAGVSTLLGRDRSAFVTELPVSRLRSALPGPQRRPQEARSQAASEKAKHPCSASRTDVLDGRAECSQPLGTKGGMSLLGRGQVGIQSVAAGVRGQRSIDVRAIHLVLPARPPERDLFLRRHQPSLRRVAGDDRTRFVGRHRPGCTPRASLRLRDASATLPGWRRPTG